MRVTLRDRNRRRIGRIDVDPAARPPRVPIEEPGEAGPREVFLQWDSALDDTGNLRRCIVCGCPDLFREKAYPPFTGVIVALAFAGSALGILGYSENPAVLSAMTAVLMLDLGVLLVARRRLVCHRCHSTYASVPITRWHPQWDRQIAARYEEAGEEGGAATPGTAAGPPPRRDPALPAGPVRERIEPAGR